MATMVGLRREQKTIVTDAYSVVDVVDGQQRLTTLVILLRAIAKALDPELTAHSKLATELEEWLVKQDDLSLLLLQTNHDTSEYYVDYIRHGKHPPGTMAKTVAEREIERAITESEGFVAEWLEKDKLLRLVTIIKNRLDFIFYEIEEEEIVYTVFEVLNSRGLSVAWLDRLKSALMAVAFEYSKGNKDEVIRELHRLWGDIYATIGLRQGLGSEALQFAATLNAANQPSKVRGQGKAVGAIREAAGADPKRAVEQSKWILSVSKAVDRFLDSDNRSKAVTGIAHARILAVAVVLRSDWSDIQKEEILATWERVSFCIFGLCGKDARTRVGSYVRLAWEIQNKKNPSKRPTNQSRRLRTGTN